ncbi:MAG TPA: response regulator transcription factor [Bryobacteraceae bacterium]|nr:response regulator transcription factor [Bryobacteraceae bacterium]
MMSIEPYRTMRLLLVEDEPAAAQMLAKGLREHGYAVDLAADGEEGLEKIHTNQYDLVILDVILPRKDGFSVCRQLRSMGSSVPVFMLTARDEVEDRIAGLNLGADDYLTKPYEYREVLARIHALLRRGPMPYMEVIEIGDLRLELKSRGVARAGRRIELTAKEYAILEYLARRQGQVVTREDLSEHAWDENYDVFSNVIEVYMMRLRKKIDAGHHVKLIRTRRGEGYVLTAGGGDA